MIITIGRQLASGGRQVAKALAARLDLAYYDKELLLEAARSSGFDAALFEHADETHHRFLYALGGGNPELFRIQSETVSRLASRGGCVFVGRCADYVLRERTDCLNVFLTADFADRVTRLSQRLSLSEKQAAELIEKTDRQRADYYNFYTNRQWGMADTYHLCLNTSRVGLEGAVRLIASCCETFGPHSA